MKMRTNGKTSGGEFFYSASFFFDVRKLGKFSGRWLKPTHGDRIRIIGQGRWRGVASVHMGGQARASARGFVVQLQRK